jgi:sterol 3beta-glucosyltransferase
VATQVAGLAAYYRDIPLALGLAVPATRTSRLPHPAMPPWPMGGLYNRLSYWAADRIVTRSGAAVISAWRREAARLGSARKPAPLRLATLVAVSPILVPRPDDWPATAHVTGFWQLPGSAPDAPETLRAFLDRGPTPICLGFGSMGDNEPAQLRAIVSEALRRAKVRAVIVTGSGGALFGVGADDTVHEVASVDYEWLFPRVQAVVHQGGVGTASFCLRAGVPQVTVAYCLDHRFWAWRLHQLGVAAKGLRRHRLTAASLAAAIRRVLDEPVFRQRAEAIAPQVQAEDGVERAVDILAGHFGFTRAESARTPPAP